MTADIETLRAVLLAGQTLSSETCHELLDEIERLSRECQNADDEAAICRAERDEARAALVDTIRHLTAKD